MKSPSDDDDDAVEALLETTRLLVGVATRALDDLDHGVSLPRFRLLLVLAGDAPLPSSVAAERLGAPGSSVTRLADALESSGHLRRGRGGANRSVVTLELTDAGRALVDRVLARRRAQLAAIVARLPEGTAAQVTTTLHAIRDAADAPGGAGPLELIAR